MVDHSWSLAVTLTGAAALSFLYLFYTAASFDSWDISGPLYNVNLTKVTLYLKKAPIVFNNPVNKTVHFQASDCNQWGLVHPYKPNQFSSSLVFAQVPKTGTVTLSHMLRNVSVDNGWKWFTTAEFRGGMEGKHKRLHFILRHFPSKPPHCIKTGFLAHVKFFDFQLLGRANPLWMSMVRDPVDRFISYYNYIRRKEGKFTELKKKYGEKEAIWWRKLDLNECILKEHKPDCNFNAEEKLFEPSPITFFCGSGRNCSLHGSRWALEQAKQNADQYFQVIGLLEYFNATLKLLEAKMPQFFKGLPKKPVILRNQAPASSKTTLLALTTPEVKSKIKSMLALEVELFEFLKKRFFRQLKAFGIHA